MTSLKDLDLSFNNLTGPIPSPPPSLKWLSIQENNLIGEIPFSICNLSSLQSLLLYQNNLGGTIPECIGNLSSSCLLYFDVEKNNFHGKIPESFAKGCMLKGFHINNNQLDGSLSRSLANCKDLNLLDVGYNNLNDTFPDWLGVLDQLQVLVLRSNRFFGHIDTSEIAFSFSHLHVIDISHNEFKGYLPVKFFKNLHAMREVYEKKANPEYMRDAWANAASDGLTGYFTESVSFTEKGLETEFNGILTLWAAIDFSNNQFIGEIPQALGELHSLLVLNLSHNYLVGPIPQGNQFNTFPADSYIENLGLCGFPLSKSCNNDGNLKPTSIIVHRCTREFTWKFAMLMGYGCGLVFGLSMGYIVFTTGKPWWFTKMIESGEQKYIRGKIRRSRGRK